MGLTLKLLRSTSVRYHKKYYKKLVSFIPYLFTFGNALCGFLSIICILEDNVSGACYSIFAAALLDGLDGALARAFGCASSLGMELDSLCDAVSFCLAPSIVVYSSYFSHTPYVGLVPVSLYLCAGLFRLARFNSSPEKSLFFKGLPTTVAACFMSTMVLYHETAYSLFNSLFVVMAVMCAIAMCMISSWPFPSLKGVVLNDARLSIMGAFFLLLTVHGHMRGYPTFFIVAIIYCFVSAMIMFAKRWQVL